MAFVEHVGTRIDDGAGDQVRVVGDQQAAFP